MPNRSKSDMASSVRLDKTDERLYSIRQLSAMTDEHAQTWRDRIHNGEIEAINIADPDGKRVVYRVRKSEYERWLGRFFDDSNDGGEEKKEATAVS